MESLNEVIAEYRNDSDAIDRGELYQPTTEYVRRLLDRIEAAARDNCRDCIHNPNGKNYDGGNAAAMREALNDIVGIANIALNVNCVGNSNNSELWNIIDKAKAALSAPARNCDNYDNKTDAEFGFVSETEEDDRNPLYWQIFANWLFAPAAERKGEGDGR